MEEEYNKNFIKLDNGYILEYSSKKEENSFGEDKIIFTSFFTTFKNSHIIQILREFKNIRKDKDKYSTKKPYIKDIKQKGIAKEKLFSLCLKNIEDLIEKDGINEKEFDKNPKRIYKSVTQYFSEELHAFLQQPRFNENIN